MRFIYLLSLLIPLTTACIAQTMPEQPLVSPLQSGVYLPGIIGPRDYSYPDFSGIVALDYNIFFNADKFKDRNGDEVNSIDRVPELGSIPLNFELSGYINALALGYVSPKIPFLGNARYLGLLSFFYTNDDLRVAYSKTTEGGTLNGFGDLLVAPAFLTWTLGKNRWDISTGYMFSAPTGRYSTGANDNIGLGYWSHMFQLFAHYYPVPEKATTLYVGNTLEFLSQIKDVNVKPGSRFALEYGISHYLHPRWELILQGSNIWQVGKDSGRDVYWDTSVKDSYGNISGGIGFWPVPGKFYSNVKYIASYGERQHFNTSIWEIELLWIPWIKKDVQLPEK